MYWLWVILIFLEKKMRETWWRVLAILPIFGVIIGVLAVVGGLIWLIIAVEIARIVFTCVAFFVWGIFIGWVLGYWIFYRGIYRGIVDHFIPWIVWNWRAARFEAEERRREW